MKYLLHKAKLADNMMEVIDVKDPSRSVTYEIYKWAETRKVYPETMPEEEKKEFLDNVQTFLSRQKNAELEAPKAPDNMRQYIGALLAETRKSLGKTQASVAKESGLPQGTIAQIENGKLNSTIDSIAKLLTLYHKKIVFVDE